MKSICILLLSCILLVLCIKLKDASIAAHQEKIAKAAAPKLEAKTGIPPSHFKSKSRMTLK